jgi:hypothetical protein
MILTIPKPLLLSMLDSTARSVGQIGGSGMVLLSADADSLAVTTADGTTEAEAHATGATISRDGRAMVDHRLISQAVKSCPMAPSRSSWTGAARAWWSTQPAARGSSC